MQENTNKTIAINSLILYGKMVINTICALLTTRFALQALGFNDFGLYSLLGGIISLVSILNTIMLSTSNRFIAVAIGKKDIVEANSQFNINIVVHLALVIITALLAFPIGDWYILHYVNYDGDISNAILVYNISIIGSLISFIGIPYNGLLMAKENFIVFSVVEVISHVLRLIVAYLLIYYFDNKLLIYTVVLALMTALPTLVYVIYCTKAYRDIVKLKIVKDPNKYKSVFKFSGWVGVGALAHVGKSQGAAVLVNAFFNTIMNSAMGIASTVNSYVSLFAQNITQPMAPQITKSYASVDYDRTNELLVMSTKYSFLMTLLISSLFIIMPEWILHLWLGSVPPYSVIFLTLFIADNLILSLNAGVQNIIFASGKLSMYQSLVTIINILSIIVGYFVLNQGVEAYYLLVVYIIMSTLKFFAIQWALHRTLNFDNSILWKKSYFPSIFIFILFIPSKLLPISNNVLKFAVSFVYLIILIYYIGLSNQEKNKVRLFINDKIKNRI